MDSGAVWRDFAAAAKGRSSRDWRCTFLRDGPSNPGWSKTDITPLVFPITSIHGLCPSEKRTQDRSAADVEQILDRDLPFLLSAGYHSKCRRIAKVHSRVITESKALGIDRARQPGDEMRQLQVGWLSTRSYSKLAPILDRMPCVGAGAD